jgi:murein DD-endopeptidase MepM/ murein hydrolase activator NlpD
MVPVKTDSRKIPAGVLVIWSVLLAGCETTPPNTADYWPEPTYLTVVVHRGDTVSDIASRYHVSVGTVQRMNDLRATASIYPGETLKLPAGSHATRAAVLQEAKQPQYAAWNAPGSAVKRGVEVHDLRAPVSYQPVHRKRVEPSVPAVDTLSTEAADEIQALTESGNNKHSSPGSANIKLASAKAPDAVLTSSGQFAWPLQGKIIAGFGKSEDGQRNDGINIAANLGEPIHAAAAGTVTYAGNELKGYGNLVLIKHDNGYVTAYAHAESMTVARGDHVEQGQVIGYTGKTGDVSSPQLHFEIRQGVTPVDPRTLLLASRES